MLAIGEKKNDNLNSHRLAFGSNVVELVLCKTQNEYIN